jgi:hypothetical protein
MIAKFLLPLIILTQISYASTAPQKQPTQINLLLKVALKKIALIPYYLTEGALSLTKKKHKAYSREYIKSLGLDEKALEGLLAEGIFANNALKPTTLTSINELSETQKKCSEVCPDSYDIFELVQERKIPTSEWHLGFLNTNEDYEDSYKKQIGFCWGYTASIDDWSNLAVFNPNSNEVVPSAEDARAFFKFFKKKIDRVMKKRLVTEIPYFESVREMSSHPLLKKYFKDRVAYRWAENAVRLESLINISLDGRAMSEKRSSKVINQLIQGLLSKQTPRIIFAALGDASYSHVLNVYGIQQMPDESIRAYVWETNFYPENIPMNSQYIEFRPDGTTHYAPLIESRIGDSLVGVVKISFENNKNHVNYKKSLVKYCRQKTQCKR